MRHLLQEIILGGIQYTENNNEVNILYMINGKEVQRKEEQYNFL